MHARHILCTWSERWVSRAMTGDRLCEEKRLGFTGCGITKLEESKLPGAVKRGVSKAILCPRVETPVSWNFRDAAGLYVHLMSQRAPIRYRPERKGQHFQGAKAIEDDSSILAGPSGHPGRNSPCNSTPRPGLPRITVLRNFGNLRFRNPSLLNPA
ncbi:hypothetical protein BS47DRAFT_953973 [Hydnum rufescens UP504]|uniref:Uncharacterized protein n=1 Tax=Hydnum rufescens UP504 TaxID=1448309 RepID=A0A9P6AX38_9AGAM|nr:hypothetical protein BS47DRAFT_953973 [Hydnum rufescens UP504]